MTVRHRFEVAAIGHLLQPYSPIKTRDYTIISKHPTAESAFAAMDRLSAQMARTGVPSDAVELTVVTDAGGLVKRPGAHGPVLPFAPSAFAGGVVRCFAFVGIAVWSVSVFAGQNAGPVFEAASIRPSSDVSLRAVDGSLMSGAVLPGGIWRARDATVVNLIRGLYPGHGLPEQVVGGPEWARTGFYDVEARATSSATADEMRQMGRALLAERFKLVFHPETRQLPALVLTLRQGERLGKGLATPAVDCTGFRSGGERPPDPTRKPFGDRLACANAILPTMPHTQIVDGADWRITAGDVRLSDLQVILSRNMGRAVVDRTGLTQRFDVELQFDMPSQTAVEAGDARAALLRTAIEEQLGLRTEDGRTSAEVLVIDHVERPSEN